MNKIKNQIALDLFQAAVAFVGRNRPLWVSLLGS